MSIATYTELKSALADWAAREDLTARIPDFIMLAEKALDIRKLRVKELLTPVVGYVSSTDDVVSFPAGGFTEVHEAKVTGTWTGTEPKSRRRRDGGLSFASRESASPPPRRDLDCRH